MNLTFFNIRYLFTSGVGDFLEILNVILSFGTTVLYAIESYYYVIDNPENEGQETDSQAKAIDMMEVKFHNP
jgi:hypothetical protein